MVVKLNSKFDLRRLARSTGSTALTRLVPPQPQEVGHCDHIELEEVCPSPALPSNLMAQSDWRHYCHHLPTRRRQQRRRDCSCSWRYRFGPVFISLLATDHVIDNIMDDVERAVDDGVNNFKALTKDQRFVAGAGATEIELAYQLADFGDKCSGLEQYAIKAFAEALEIVPYTLAENAGVKATEVIANLYLKHKEGNKTVGFDNEGEGPATKDAAAANILDHMMSKHWAIRYAARAACTVLKVDQVIYSSTSLFAECSIGFLDHHGQEGWRP